MKINGVVGDQLADRPPVAMKYDDGSDFTLPATDVVLECDNGEKIKLRPSAVYPVFDETDEKLWDCVGRRVTITGEPQADGYFKIEGIEHQKYTFFYGGVFSQWFACEFEVDGVKYRSAEHYMMAGKARLFNDDIVLAQMMDEKNSHPRKQKALGREVKGRAGGKWDADDIAYWNSKARDVVYEGNWHKFTQNEELQEALFRTAGTILVEASPSDRLWGIGHSELKANSVECQLECHWRGVNWLGEVLTKLRDDLVAGIHRTDNFGWKDNIHLYDEPPPV